MKKVIAFAIAAAALSVITACVPGCAFVSGSAGGSSYVGWAFGEKAASGLAGLVVTDFSTVSNGVYIVHEKTLGLDKAGSKSETDLKFLGSIFLSGLAAFAQQQPAPSAANCANGSCIPQQ